MEWYLEVGSKDSILLCGPVLSLEVFESSLTLWKRANKAKQGKVERVGLSQIIRKRF